MKNGLLSIGEFAKLRGINVKSLRYYEKIGALAPAYVNPESGYRYYSINQLSDLDVVLTLIELGIPLKDIARHADPSVPRDASSLELIERGKALAQSRIERAQEQLLQLQNYSDELTAFNAHSSIDQTYERYFEERLCLCRELPSEYDMTDYAQSTNELYETAPSLDLVPLYTQGIIIGDISYETNTFDPGSNLKNFAFMQVVRRPGTTNDPAAVALLCEQDDIALAHLPEATYSCELIRSEDFNTSFNLGLKKLQQSPRPSILSEAWSAMLNPNEFFFEVQVPQY